MIRFLQRLRDRGKPAWQRRQAVRAIEFYRSEVLKSNEPSLSDIRDKLAELAAAEQRTSADTGRDGRPADMPGAIDPTEPELIQRLRRELRIGHYALRTEKAYVDRAKRFSRHCASVTLDGVGENEVKEYLGTLAVQRNVSASTQNQAFSALLFLFQKVLRRDFEFVDAVRARTSERLPVVLTRSEIERLLGAFGGRDLLIAQLLYGAGVRHLECLRLRAQDVEFETEQLIVRDGKGAKDRVTVLPRSAIDGLRKQIESARVQHQQDLAEGFGRVLLPYALAEKYAHADREFAWQWVFPASRMSRDPRSGLMRRHHRHESVFAAAMKRAASRASIEKNIFTTLSETFIRDASAAMRNGYPYDPGADGAQRRVDDDDLYSCVESTRHCRDQSAGLIDGVLQREWCGVPDVCGAPSSGLWPPLQRRRRCSGPDCFSGPEGRQ